MQNNSLTLFLEIDDINLNFFIIENKEYEYEVVFKTSCPIDGIENNRITNFEKFLTLLKIIFFQ